MGATKGYPLSAAGFGGLLGAQAGGDGTTISYGGSYTRTGTGTYAIVIENGVTFNTGICLATPRGSVFCWCTVEHVDAFNKIVRVWNASGLVDNDFDFIALSGAASGQVSEIGIQVVASLSTAHEQVLGDGYLRGGKAAFPQTGEITVTDQYANGKLIVLATPVSDTTALVTVTPVANVDGDSVQEIFTATNVEGSPFADVAVGMVAIDPSLIIGSLANACGRNDPGNVFTTYGCSLSKIGTGHYRINLGSFPLSFEQCIILATVGHFGVEDAVVEGAITVEHVSDVFKDVFTFDQEGADAADQPFSFLVLTP